MEKAALRGFHLEVYNLSQKLNLQGFYHHPKHPLREGDRVCEQR